MHLKHLLSVGLLLTAHAVAGHAQQYYDITEHYLQNSRFDAQFDYNASATGNVTNTVKTISGWTLDPASKSTMAVGATFQYGTSATFYGASIPAAGPDGSSQGGCLTLCAAMTNELTFYQTVKMPAGHYRLEVSYRNCNSESQVGTGRSGWWVSATDETLSTLTSFAQGEWLTETIDFVLTDITSGRIKVGFKAGSGLTAKSAMLTVDHVALLRDTPYGDIDDITPAPTVVTDTRFARGATMAFGRIKSATGDDITERGFCWAETPNPTIADHKTTDYLTNKGTIYWLKDLTPATKYYMRAYAMTRTGKVGYGEVIKFYTLPKGSVTYWYNNGGDEATNTRVNNAAAEACDIFSNLTEIKKKYNIGYSPGTPTADCAYQDEPWINMGANSSYQRTGTIMHEMEHGLGLVPYSTQWNKNILRSALDGSGRGTGLWLGDRVSAFLDFWDNTTGSHLNGDFQHMWPYGVNGANEDNGSKELYFANAMIGQALGEDGLEHRSNTFAEPCYILDQEDDVKYYLKNESEERGLYTSYLVPTKTGTLEWHAMTAAEAAANDSVAWYITFTPANQYYQLRNAATGQYITYSTSFRTAAKTTPTTAENFHLMKGRVDVGTGSHAKRGYWLVHPTGNLSPNCLQANAGGATASATFNIANSATTQRWLILTADEMATQEQSALASLRQRVVNDLQPIKALANVPHTEEVNGTDADFQQALADLDTRLQEATTTTQLTTLNDDARTAAFNFLSNVTPKYANQPFNMTYMLQNPGLDALDGWTGTPTLNYSCAEYFQTTFTFTQQVQNLPAGNYQVRAQGFQRPGASADAYSDYAAGNNNVTAFLYAGSDAKKLAHIASEAQTASIGGSESTVGSGLYMPNNMQAASLYFAKGLYDNNVVSNVATAGGALRFGIRSAQMPNAYWVIFDNFRLYFYGNMSKETIEAGIDDITTDDPTAAYVYYDLQGRRVATPTKGLYIVRPANGRAQGKDGRKVVLK